MRKSGKYIKIGNLDYFVPDPLPPKDPPFAMDNALSELYGETMRELGKLNEIAHRLPDAYRFVKGYVAREALLSLEIEGINTTLIDVYTQPLLETNSNKNTQLVLNYTRAFEVALNMIQNEGMPIVSRVILEAHKTLMSFGQGDKANPGNYRKQAVRVGNLVPPPPNEIPQLMQQLELFINVDETVPAIIRAGLAHVQFETIHPFLDGNGRIGRLLIVLMLIQDDILSQPIMYPSYYFKKHRMSYYHYLDQVRTKGDFEAWITFYLTALKESSIDAYLRAQEIEALQKRLIALIESKSKDVRAKEKRLKALSIIFSFPVISIGKLKEEMQISYNTAQQIIVDFVSLGILRQKTEKKRYKLYQFEDYLHVLQKEIVRIGTQG